MIRAAFISPLMLAACGQAPAQQETSPAPGYHRVETRLLDRDLIQVNVKMSDPRGNDDLRYYADCTAARYTGLLGYEFARHLRTNLNKQGGVWAADAVYTISPTLPRGSRTIDVKEMVAECADNGIPTV